MMRMRFATLAIGLGLAAAACSGKPSQPATGGTTVSLRTIPGVGQVLTDAAGHALYSPKQEASGQILCTGACTNIWIPVPAPASGQPTKGPGVTGALGVVQRPDGQTQVTFDGAPLYRFFQDTAPGQVNGNGATDAFGGHSFTWHVETVGAAAAGTGGSSGGYGGGYGG
jgi:predicted lipoprotein with Yx(FWY)xxD motif